MLRIEVICLFLIVVTIFSHPYNPWCRSGCNQQLPCGVAAPPCGGYNGQFSQCCGGYNGGYYGGYGVPMIPTGYPGYTGYPNLSPSIPNQPSVIFVDPNNPSKPPSQDPIRVVVDTSSKEWLCPVDPQPRGGAIFGSPDLVECTKDENCVSYPIRHKCCFDNGVGGEVCKPAILA